MLLLDPNNYHASDSKESLLPDERDSFADEPVLPQTPGQRQGGLQVSELMKQKAKEQALKRLGRPIDKKINQVGQKVGLSPESLSRLGEDTPENREKLKEEAKDRAKKYSKDVGKKVEKKIAGAGKGGVKGGERLGQAGKGVRAAQEAKTAATATKGAKTAATAAKGAKTAATAAKGAKIAAVGAKGLQTAIAAAGVASGPETLGLGTIVAFLLNIAISLGISDAIDCLFELKAGNYKKAIFHAIKAAMLIIMFLILLIAFMLNLSVIGIILGAPLLVGLNIYAVLGMMFPSIPQLQGLSRKWMLAIIVLLDLYVIIMIVVIFAGVMFGVCTETAIGSLLGYGGVIGGVVDYIDTSRFGTGGYLSALNEICAAILK